MKNFFDIDIYLGFTQCKGNCIFCRKGLSLVHFPRAQYSSNGYKFIYFDNPYDINKNIFEPYKSYKHIKIHISGNEPLYWDGLQDFIKMIKLLIPQSLLTLRISNTLELDNNISYIIDRYEFSIYGHTKELHNSITGNLKSWDILFKNISTLEKLGVRDKIYFQTIFISQNIKNSDDIILLLNSLSLGNIFKVVYPYFMPIDDISSLLSKKEVLKKLLTSDSRKILQKNGVLVNFSLPSRLHSIFTHRY